MNGLTEREAELVAIAAAVGSNCVPCLEYHVGVARDLGIEDTVMNAAIKLADKVKRVPAAKVLKAAKELLSEISPESESSINATA